MSTCVPQVLMGAQFTTYRIGGPLDEAYQPTTEAELVAILRQTQAAGKPLTILGWGGNSIIASAGIRGVTIITRKLDWVEPITDTRMAFGAGVHLAKAASTGLKYGLTGGEFMIGIPGTIGGALRMNAGALGQETANLVRSVNLYNLETAQVETWLPEQLGFQYRKSAIDPKKHVVLSAELEFQPGNPAEISATMTQSVQFRKSHHPKEPNGGSVFKNPSRDMPAGKLMEELGAKGQWREGGAMVSPLHGNFIVNVDHATSLDVLRLMRRMQQAIKDRYGLDAHPENLLLGDASPEEQALWQALTAGH
ncbi:UDP-N-acetylmuramate dehydrogenase [Vampirovibrio chlorellavorus]|uniref:UDP-N-acetylmuramate dehydrogenase n=1 Tax=Vampirovibrio chlorellavorus TaxID=758823 RepID=UPI0026EC4416|nr:UDP-N-acetylmuramate dehydrogenase [Vampirovibrio chlorellavorus]